MRVYWPTTLAELARVVGAGDLAPAPAVVHAVTRTLRDFYADADPRDLEEELEYVAMSDAAEQSVRLLGQDPSAAPRRVVLALDVADDAVEVQPDAGWAAPERSRVTVTVPLSLDALASVHVDDAEAEADVRAAVAVLAAADAGDEDARFTVEACEGHDLLWYDASELPVLLAVGP
ncbi:DUF6912 family protein [Kineococcus radiotolerans]|uniref:Uncharacterized protein n=1 Tax=Kineococcus radiotolerans (strain ATCC BAA-149 / DSM 14245 / SRS30216) TaxID=266940 RepID=A6WEM3_KINRD|nr:hypothetical protein [Kineococcus radiotolerans]ABS05262.1 conserved hypothetical protein [Kineococcus radiotolerans SRS30216 = ATCC BAA-149]